MDQALSPDTFFATVPVRALLLRAGRAVRSLVLSRYLRADRLELIGKLGELENAGLVASGSTGYTLTDEGEASVRWSAPPPPNGTITPRWVTELARSLAEHYEVSVSDMLKGEIGSCVIARSRLCFALWARGWAYERIEEHFGLPAGWARRAVERWKRMRDQDMPKTGPELRAWRERLGLSQVQAAAKLGVNRRTVQRAERYGAFTAKSSLGRVV